jgi:hypothetical protein
VTTDATLIRDAQRRSTGATVHGLANLLNAYQFAAELDDVDAMDRTTAALYAFGATGQLTGEFARGVTA